MTRSVPPMLDRGSDGARRTPASASACEASGMRPAWSPLASADGYHRLQHASLDLLRRPLLFVEEMIVQLLQPAGEDGVGGLLLGSETVLLLSCCTDTRTASFLDPLANLGPIELEQVALAASAAG